MGENIGTLPAVRPRSDSRRKFPISRQVMTRFSALVIWLGSWEAAARAGLVDTFFFSSPSLIGNVLYQQFSSGTIYRHLQATVEEALWGLFLGFLAGATLGWLAAQHRFIAELVEPVLMLLNSVPRIVVAPIFIMWFGIGPNSKIALAFFLVFVVIFFAVYSGLKEVDRSLVERVVVLGGGQRDLLMQVYIPSVLVWVFSSLRVTVGFAFTGAIVGEFIASSRGLGYLLNFAQNSYNASLMLATVALIMVVISLLFVVLGRVEAYAMRWKQAR
jgi:NitT/TauT family transport system permease protein